MNHDHHICKKNITISPHADMRMEERTQIPKRDRKLVATKARNYGIIINEVSVESTERFDAPLDLLFYLKSKARKYHGTDKALLYRDHVYYFAGFKSRTLKTVMTIPEEYQGWWKDKERTDRKKGG